MEKELKVMLVEDNPEDVFLTMKVLKRNKLDKDLIVSMDGRDALSKLESLSVFGERLPDLILLDINLPVLSGLSLLSQLKEDNRFSGIPIVMLTCSNVDFDIQKSYDLGARTYLVKPISNEDLLLVLSNLFH